MGGGQYAAGEQHHRQQTRDRAEHPFAKANANFLSLPFPRAFVVAPGGQIVTAQSGYDPLARALTLCRQHMLNCHPYAINDRVIWVPLLPLN